MAEEMCPALRRTNSTRDPQKERILEKKYCAEHNEVTRDPQ